MKKTRAKLSKFQQVTEKKRERCALARFIAERNGLSVSSVLLRLRLHRIEEWEKVGMLNCIRLFANDTTITDIYEWYDRLPCTTATGWADHKHHKMELYAFMSGLGMCREAFNRHMTRRDFTELEMRGLISELEEYEVIHNS